MTTALAKVEQQLTQLMTTAQEIRTGLATADDMMRGIKTAMAVNQLMHLLIREGVIEHLKSLHNSPLGYLTDETEGGRRYTTDAVAGFVAHCLIDGDPLYGGHVMIFSGKKYRTKTGWMKALRDAGATHVQCTAFAPEDIQKSTTSGGSERLSGRVAVVAACVVAGKEYSVQLRRSDMGDARVVVEGMGKTSAACVTQMKGKAEARALQRLHTLITGIDTDEEAGPVIDVTDASRPSWTLSPTLEAVMDANIQHVEAQIGPPVEIEPQASVETPQVPADGPDSDGHWRDEANELRDRFPGPEGDLAPTWYAELMQQKSVRQLSLAAQAWGRVKTETKLDAEHPVAEYVARLGKHLKAFHGGAT